MAEKNVIPKASIKSNSGKNLDRKGIVELGASDTLSLMDIANKLNLKPEYEGKKIIIHSDRIEENMPNVKEVWSFIDEQMRKTKN